MNLFLDWPLHTRANSTYISEILQYHRRRLLTIYTIQLEYVGYGAHFAHRWVEENVGKLFPQGIISTICAWHRLACARSRVWRANPSVRDCDRRNYTGKDFINGSWLINEDRRKQSTWLKAWNNRRDTSEREITLFSNLTFLENLKGLRWWNLSVTHCHLRIALKLGSSYYPWIKQGL